MAMRFFLGTHRPHWLWTYKTHFCVSIRTLRRYKTWSVSKLPWILDSGGFSELSLYGKWTIAPEQYVEEIERANREIGHLFWAAPQDWMCESWIIKKTGLSIHEHQKLTTENFYHLKELQAKKYLQRIRPPTPIIPVLQGQTIDDYLSHAKSYDKWDLKRTVVGIGSVCRRQSTNEIKRLFKELKSLGIRMHGFGVKVDGLRKYGKYLQSSDSAVWSYIARRRNIQLEGHQHTNCANCYDWAKEWYETRIANRS